MTDAATLLVEIFTEELPPKALSTLGEAFADGIFEGLKQRGLTTPGSKRDWFATPRRLAVSVSEVLQQAPARAESKKLMPAKVAFDEQGRYSPALQKRLEKEGYPPGIHLPDSELPRRMEGGAEFVFLDQVVPGATLQTGLQDALEAAIENLPVPKMMRYQDAAGNDVLFVRPAHGLVALHGADVVPVGALGLDAGRVTHGHRFQGRAEIVLADADEYAQRLRNDGRVEPDFAKRVENIRTQLNEQASALRAQFSTTPALSLDEELIEQSVLVDEVAALVEQPTVYVGQFDAEFLAVPQECLILTMQQNQKYFPLFDANGKLVNKFLIVSNMRLDDPSHIVEGNQRVVRPRLADARFFFEQDRKTKLKDRVPRLANVVYHNKLGSQLERVERLRKIADHIATLIGADAKQARDAAWLSKADLLTGMVGEFPELQGTMGCYYALHDGEDWEVAKAIGTQYATRFQDAGSAEKVALCVALAERTETLVGIYGIGLVPTGDKDPFALRRAALVIIDIFKLLGEETLGSGSALDLRLAKLFDFAASVFPAGKLAEGLTDSLLEFVLERYRNQLIAMYDHDRDAVEAVLALKPEIHEIKQRVQAVLAFKQLPEADALAAANKRTRNILKKADGEGLRCDPNLFSDEAERRLHTSMKKLAPDVDAKVADRDYTGALRQLASIRGEVDQFFDDVMVMTDDAKVRDNRLALLGELERLLNQVADISRLAA